MRTSFSRVALQPPEEGVVVRLPGSDARIKRRRERREFARQAARRSARHRRRMARAPQWRFCSAPSDFTARKLGLIRRAALDRGTQRLGGDGQRASPGRPHWTGRALRHVGGKRFDGAFERRNAVRKRIEVAALDAGLGGALRVPRRRPPRPWPAPARSARSPRRRRRGESARRASRRATFVCASAAAMRFGQRRIRAAALATPAGSYRAGRRSRRCPRSLRLQPWALAQQAPWLRSVALPACEPERNPQSKCRR